MSVLDQKIYQNSQSTYTQYIQGSSFTVICPHFICQFEAAVQSFSKHLFLRTPLEGCF